MALIRQLILAMLTRNEGYAGSKSYLNLTINVDGKDVVDREFGDFIDGIGKGNAGIYDDMFDRESKPLDPFESIGLTNSSVRLGIRGDKDQRGDNAWGPQHILLVGLTEGEVLALATELDLDLWLSTDRGEGHLSMPLRLVSSGSPSTVIRRVLLLLSTDWGDDDGTDDPIELEITAGGRIVVQQEINDTSQTDLDQGSHNWYFLDVAVPFTLRDVSSNGGIKLRIHGTDAWLPAQVLLFGLNTTAGRPSEIVSLSAITTWHMGKLSRDEREGRPSVDLPVLI
jgi:hypothetical protein